MAQATVWNVQRSSDGATTPDAFAERIEDMLETAAISSHSGTARPSYAVAGTLWWKSDTLELMLYDGAVDIAIRPGGPSAQTRGEVTISAGEITSPRLGLYQVDTEGDAATDDLETITMAGAVDGDMLVLRAENDARTVVVRNGVGNIACGADRTLDNTLDRLVLQWHAAASTWVQIAFNDNGA
ncbi:hypothetical protein [Halovulum sp. GXIMD14793]